MNMHIPNITLGFTDACIYCGDKCIVEFDHVIPCSYMSLTNKRNYSDNKRGIKISSCKRCNRLLSSRVLWNFLDRFNCIKRKLEVKYKKYHSMPEWTDSEIDELDYSLATFVAQQRSAKNHVSEISQWTETYHFKKAVKVLMEQCHRKNDPVINKIFNSFFVEYGNASL